MTGTPSEPTSDKLDDDLAETGVPRGTDEDSNSSSDPAHTADRDNRDNGDSADAPVRPRRKKRKSSAAPPPQAKSRPIARILAIAVLLGIPIVLIVSSRTGASKAGGAGKLPASTGWAAGSEQSIDITLVPQDRTNLACASASEVAGHHCQFEAQNKPWSKGGPGDDKVQYKPYRLAGTNDPVLVAGLWSDAGMTRGPLPTDRFTAKCKLKVEGKAAKLSVRWNPADPWFEEPFDWPAGTVSNCTIVR